MKSYVNSDVADRVAGFDIILIGVGLVGIAMALAAVVYGRTGIGLVGGMFATMTVLANLSVVLRWRLAKTLNYLWAAVAVMSVLVAPLLTPWPLAWWELSIPALILWICWRRFGGAGDHGSAS